MPRCLFAQGLIVEIRHGSWSGVSQLSFQCPPSKPSFSEGAVRPKASLGSGGLVIQSHTIVRAANSSCTNMSMNSPLGRARRGKAWLPENGNFIEDIETVSYSGKV